MPPTWSQPLGLSARAALRTDPACGAAAGLVRIVERTSPAGMPTLEILAQQPSEPLAEGAATSAAAIPPCPAAPAAAANGSERGRDSHSPWGLDARPRAGCTVARAAGEAGRTSYEGVLDALVRIRKEEGLAALFKKTVQHILCRGLSRIRAIPQGSFGQTEA